MAATYDLAGQVIGLAMKVHRTLGPGFLESVYVNALRIELQRTNLKAETEVSIDVRYEGEVIGKFFADLLIEDDLIVEVKAVTSIIAAHEVQTVNYLSATGRNAGLLLNFGGQSLEFRKRFRLGKAQANDTPALHENSVNSVNSVCIQTQAPHLC